MGLGAYPTISLAEARVEADRCRKLVAQGIDPRNERKQVLRAETFRDATAAYFELKREGLKGNGTAGRWLSPIDNHVIPKIGDRPVAELSLEDLVEVLKPIWRNDTGRKAHDRIAQIMTHAKARNPAVLENSADIKKDIGALLPHVRRKSEHHPSLPWEQVPELWLSLDDTVTHAGLKFYLLTLPRTANVTNMVWSEVDWETRVWDIPPEQMKNGKAFSAPLSRQALKILKLAKAKFKNHTDFVFPSETAWKKGVISENTWGKWLKDHGWKDPDGRFAVPHGFRASFGTWCGDNQICEKDMQKRCIQHVVDSDEDAAYLRSKLLPPRLDVMQAWADHVTSLETAKLRSFIARSEHAENLDLPAEKAGPDGTVRTRREVEEWLRADEEEFQSMLHDDSVPRKKRD
jgi:integrase